MTFELISAGGESVVSEIPDHLRRFLPERSEPTPAERFDAYLAEHEAKGTLGPPRRIPRGRPVRWSDWAKAGVSIAGTAALIVVVSRVARLVVGWIGFGS